MPGADILITISLCMIVKNEEKVLARCLESAKGFADEIIIVDTGSQDRTKEIARAYTEKIYHGLLYVAGRGRRSDGGKPGKA